MASRANNHFEIPDNLKNIYGEIEVSPIGVLKNYALNVVQGKVQKYEAENKHFEKKYGCLFEKFKKKNQDLKNQEVFEEDDDLLDWEFACENLKYWRKKAKELNNE